MSLGGRTDVVLKFYDSWNRGEIDFDELVDEDIVNHQPDVEPELGRDRFREAIAGVMAAVPDSRWDVSDVLADRERVAIRGVLGEASYLRATCAIVTCRASATAWMALTRVEPFDDFVDGGSQALLSPGSGQSSVSLG